MGRIFPIHCGKYACFQTASHARRFTFLSAFQIEYDKATEFMHSMEIHYNRRKASKETAYTAPELRNRICDELLGNQIFEDPNYDFREHLNGDDKQMGSMVSISMNE